VKKEGQRTTLASLNKERRNQPITNGNNGNDSKPVFINQIQDKNPDHIEVIKGNGYRPQDSSQSQQRQQYQINETTGQ
jgi:hypothetical protein